MSGPQISWISARQTSSRRIASLILPDCSWGLSVFTAAWSCSRIGRSSTSLAGAGRAACAVRGRFAPPLLTLDAFFDPPADFFGLLADFDLLRDFATNHLP
jgi:hypothetical protein